MKQVKANPEVMKTVLDLETSLRKSFPNLKTVITGSGHNVKENKRENDVTEDAVGDDINKKKRAKQ